jgi:hypothetical protein
MLSLAILLTVISSCSKVIDVSLPDRERKIVINGLATVGEPLRINLSKSLSVLENDTLLPLTGAHLTLYHGTEVVGNLSELTYGFYSLPGFIPVVGESYRLEASGGGLEPVSATATLPALVPIVSVDTSLVYTEWGSEQIKMKVTFNDPAGIHNYYMFAMNLTYKEFDYVTQTFTGRKLTENQYVSGNEDDRFFRDESHYFGGKIVFDDLLFDGKEKQIDFDFFPYSYYESDTVWLSVRLDQIDPSYFKYALSYEAMDRSGGNPFAEPVQVYSNVEGGFGLFAGCTADSIVLVTHGNGRK